MAYFTTSDGVPLYYSDTGEGRPLMLQHALMFGGDLFWRKNIPALARGCRTIALDARGNGMSGKPNRGYTIPRLAQDLRELILHLGLSDVVLAGLSLGGFTSIEYLRTFGSDRLGALVLMEMTPRLPSAPGWEHPTFGNFPEEMARGYGAALRADRGIYNDFFNAAFLAPPTGRELADMLANTWLTPTDAAAEIIDRMAERDDRAFLGQIALPTALFYGYPNNRILPTAIGQWMQSQIPGSQLVLFERSSHCPFWEEPDKFNAELLHFVREAGR
jgi:pimeloyl-ACP methyl ester carboxylesterase